MWQLKEESVTPTGRRKIYVDINDPLHCFYVFEEFPVQGCTTGVTLRELKGTASIREVWLPQEIWDMLRAS